MKVFAGVVVLVMLLLAGTAVGKTIFYKGKGEDDPKVNVSFDVHGPRDRKHGGINLEDARVESFFMEHATVTVTCPEGGVSHSEGGFGLQGPIEVDKDGDFRGKETVGPLATVLKGELRDGAFARGWARYYGKPDECSLDTGKVFWKANNFG